MIFLLSMFLQGNSFRSTPSPHKYPQTIAELSKTLYSEDVQMAKYAVRELQRQSSALEKKRRSSPDSIVFLEAKRDTLQITSLTLPACTANIYKSYLVLGCLRIAENLEHLEMLNTAESQMANYPQRIQRKIRRQQRNRSTP